MRTQTKEIQENLTPKDAQRILVEGNKRFVSNVKEQRNLIAQVMETSEGQYPFAVVLSCIDSRVPAELIFDQGIGDIFSVRVAGNIVNEDVLGSMEYGCKVAGAKIVVVMGHSKCGAVTAACNKVEMGNITHLLKKIEPAVSMIHKKNETISVAEIEDVAIQNIFLSLEKIRADSSILSEMETNGEIQIVGAYYNVSTAEVKFFNY